MLDRELLLASIACGRKGMRLEPISETEAVPELVCGKGRSVGPVGEGRQPCSGFPCPPEAALGVWRAVLEEVGKELFLPGLLFGVGSIAVLGVGLEIRL